MYIYTYLVPCHATGAGLDIKIGPTEKKARATDITITTTSTHFKHGNVVGTIFYIKIKEKRLLILFSLWNSGSFVLIL